MKKFSLIIVLLFSLTILSAQENAQWRGDNRDGKYMESGLMKTWPETGPELLWHFDQLGEGHASAAVTNTMVLISGTEDENGFVIAFDHTGNQLWKKVYGKEWMESYNGVRSTPVIYNGMVYMLSGLGELVAMNSKNGDIVWRKNILNEFNGDNIRWGVTENLVVDGDNLYCSPGGSEGNVIALNRKTGDLIWQCKGNGEKTAYCSPALVNLPNRKLLITHTQNSILGIDADNGELLWSFEHTNQYSIHPNTPLYHDGYLYCFSGYGKGGVMLKLSDDGTSVKEIWKSSTLDSQMGGAILLDGKIYGSGHTNREWYCLDWKTGNVLFSSKMMSKGNVIFADGQLYCYGDNGEVALVDVSQGSFEKKGSFRVPFGEKQHWAHLVIHNKCLYVRHGNSLMVYSIAN